MFLPKCVRNCGHYFFSEERAKEILKKGQEKIDKGAELAILTQQNLCGEIIQFMSSQRYFF